MSYFNSVASANGPEAPISKEVASQTNSNNSTSSSVTYLIASGPPVPLNKAYSIDTVSGQLTKTDYQNGYKFHAVNASVDNIDDLSRLISQLSKDPTVALIRGLKKPNVKQVEVQRTKENFEEHPDGSYFVMLDFDNISSELDPLSVDAIESIVAKLPPEFHNASYFYQHSNSAGICDQGGNRLKSGVNVHLFFWLNRRVKGPVLNAYLQLYCYENNHYSVGENKAGYVEVKTIIDPAPIRSHVQLHYIAAPTINEGVQCDLKAEQRQGLVRKEKLSVVLPVIVSNIESKAKQMKYDLKREYELANGYTHQKMTTYKPDGSLALHEFSIVSSGTIRTERTLARYELSTNRQYVTLYFADENSPGSWFVSKHTPQFGTRHGDYHKVTLKELCPEAHALIRDTLKWFSEVPHHHLELQDGYLPSIETFATAKVALILAPTGSGKTKAAIDWIGACKDNGELIIYVAPTIALVNQMYADLTNAGLSCGHYQNIELVSVRDFAVIVTTNESLPKFVRADCYAYKPFKIIFDEIHSTFDSVMGNEKRAIQFHDVILKANKTLLLTGTMTDVQRICLTSVIGQAYSKLAEDNYCCYEFTPFKKNPIVLRRSSEFYQNVYALFSDLKVMKEDNQSLPRVVIVVDSSKMKVYEMLLAKMGLADEAHVVSRPESSQAAIEEARVSQRPILITSPLFGVGINLANEPNVLWACFDRINADTNQIVQTLNRANRGQVACKVAIYGNVDDKGDELLELPEKSRLKAEVRSRIEEETTIAGLLEEYWHIDRVTYLSLRKLEKNSTRSLTILHKADAIQNFTFVEDENELNADKTVREIKSERDQMGKLKKNARYEYEVQVEAIRDSWKLASQNELLIKLEALSEERERSHLIHAPRVDREIQNDELAIVMLLCNVSANQARRVNIVKLRRLFNDLSPWMSCQYNPDFADNWALAMAEKCLHIAYLLNRLNKVRADQLTPQDLVNALTRNRTFASSFWSLSGHDSDYQQIHEKIDRYKLQRDRARARGSDKHKQKVARHGFELLESLLSPLGIYFERQKSNGRTTINYDWLIVPAGWDLVKMEADMLREHVRLKSLPYSQKTPIVEESEYSSRLPMAKEVCSTCVFYKQMSCTLGHPIDSFEQLDDIARENTCREYQLYKPVKFKG